MIDLLKCPAIVVAWCVIAPFAAGAEPKRFEFRERHMGAEVRLVFYAESEPLAKKVAKAAYARVAELDRKFSDWKSSSELIQLCLKSEIGKPSKVSDDLFAVLSHAQQIAKASDGAFDMTIGPVVRLWRRARRQKRLPKPDNLKAAMARIGYQHVKLDEKAKTVTLFKEKMRLDLGGIAKGYVGDAVLSVFKKAGVNRVLIDCDGDLVLGAAPPGKKGWKIGIAPLTDAEAAPTRFLTLADCAVATSGDAFQFVEIAGKRYSHIVDPKTGLGVTLRSSVTVISRRGWKADALASAISVLGPNNGLALAKKQKVACRVVWQTKNAVRERMTERFAE